MATVKDHFSFTPSSETGIKNVIEAENKIVASEILAPKLTLFPVDKCSLTELPDVARVLVKAVNFVTTVRASLGNSRRATEELTKLRNVVNSLEFNSIFVAPAPSDKVHDKLSRSVVVLDLDKLINFIIELRSKFPNDPEAVGLNSLVLRVLTGIYTRRAIHWQPCQQSLDTADAEAIAAAVETEPIVQPSQVCQTRNLRGALAGRSGVTAPKVVLVQLEKFSTEDVDRAAELLDKALRCVDEEFTAGNERGINNTRCFSRLAELVPREERVKTPGIFICSSQACDLGGDSDVVVDLVKLREIAQLALDSDATTEGVTNREAAIRVTVRLLKAEVVQSLRAVNPGPSLADELEQALSAEQSRRPASRATQGIQPDQITYENIGPHTPDKTDSFVSSHEYAIPLEPGIMNNHVPHGHTSNMPPYDNSSRPRQPFPQSGTPEFPFWQESSRDPADRRDRPRLPLPLYKQCVDLHDFLQKFEDRMDEWGCSPKLKISYLEEAIRGSELQHFVERYLFTNGRACSWTALRRDMEDNFIGPHDRQDKKFKMEDRILKPGESVRNYIQEKLHLLVRWNPTMSEMEQIDYILQGLPTNYQRDLRATVFTDLRTMQVTLINLERNYNRFQNWDQAAPPVSRVTVIEPQPEITVDKITESMVAALQRVGLNNRSPSRERRPRSRDPTPYRAKDSGDSRYPSRESSRDRGDRSRPRERSRDRSGRYDRSRERPRSQSGDRLNRFGHGQGCRCSKCVNNNGHAYDCKCPKCSKNGEQ